MKHLSYFDLANDVRVKFVEFFGWNPKLFMNPRPNNFPFKLCHIFVINFKPRDVANITRSFVPRVPLFGNLNCLFFVQNRIENRLNFKPRRERFKLQVTYEL